MGGVLEGRLLAHFDREVDSLGQQIEAIQDTMAAWEPKMMSDLTDNRRRIQQFDEACKASFAEMRGALSEQFRRTEHYERLVVERSEELETKVFEVELVRMERERDQMEKEMTELILEFNHRVHSQAGEIEAKVKEELHGIREQIEDERAERIAKD